jgi:hypothetical protein
MLAEPDNLAIIELVKDAGYIQIYDQNRLEREVLSHYFRHSKYSSFHCQLNYHGFRVIGKLTQGKMSLCCYVMQTGTLSVLSDLLAKWDCWWRNKDNKEKEIVRYNGVACADNDVDRYTPTAFSPSVVWRDGMMSSKGGEGGCNEDDKEEAIVGHDGDNGADFDGHLASISKLVGKV